jgi:hypothetical protein
LFEESVVHRHLDFDWPIQFSQALVVVLERRYQQQRRMTAHP